MSYVLDTNAVASLMRAEQIALTRLRSLARNEVWLPQPVVAEIQYGLARLPASRKRSRLEQRWQLFAAELQRATWNDEVSLHFGKTKTFLEKRGDRLDDFDLAIAAHALALEATLVTGNRKHLARVPGLEIETWA